MCVSVVKLGVNLYSCPAAGVERVSTIEWEGPIASGHRVLGECGMLALSDPDSSFFVDSAVFNLG